MLQPSVPVAHHPPPPSWLALPAISHNLLRAAGSLASLGYAIAPDGWHHEAEWMTLFEAATGPPAHTA